MKKNILLISICLLFLVFAGHASQQVHYAKSYEIKVLNGRQYYIHRVQQGQTLHGLSKLYELSAEEIIYENPSVKYGLNTFQELKIPVLSRDYLIEQSLNNEHSDFFYHIVCQNEQMEDIAEIYSVSLNQLRQANPETYTAFREGQYIKIPVPKGSTLPEIKQILLPDTVKIEKKPELEKPKYLRHIVQWDENIYRIALKYGMSVEELKQHNPSVSEKLMIDQLILIPTNRPSRSHISHVISRKETPVQIAKTYGITPDLLYKANPSITSRARSGKIIRIPVPKAEQHLNMATEEIFAAPPEKTISQDSLLCISGEKHREKTYKIALMIPFYLEEVESMHFSPELSIEEFSNKPSFRFIHFYYGALMAIDSLKRKGMNIDLHVYDVDVNIAKTIKVFQTPGLKQMDLIIGPFFNKSFALAANFAKIFKIPIVNPLSKRSEIVNGNPYVYKFQSSIKFQDRQVFALVNTYFKDARIMLIKHKNIYEDSVFSSYSQNIGKIIANDIKVPNSTLLRLAIEKAFAENVGGKNTNPYALGTFGVELADYVNFEGNKVPVSELEYFIEDSFTFRNDIAKIYYEYDSIKGIEQKASALRKNVMLVFSEDNVFSLNLLTKLNILRDTFQISVVGLPDWQNFQNMDNELFMNLNVHVLSQEHVDYSDYRVKHFIQKYRRTFFTDPADYAFKGFDISYYFLSLLMNFGSDFQQCLPYYSIPLLQSSVKFEKMGEGNGFENTHWDLLRYRNYQLQKLKIR